MPAYIFTKPVILGTYSWALLIHFADSINNDSGSVLLRVVIITTLHAGVLISLYCVKALLLDRVRPGLVPALTLAALAILGITRGFLLENWLFAWDISAILDTGLRMQTSLLNIVSSFSVAIVSTANARMHQMRNIQLLNELERLEGIKVDALERINATDHRAVQSIKVELDSHVKSMQGRTIADLLIILRAMIDTVVQPLSRQLEMQGKVWQPPEIREEKVQINWGRAFKAGLHPGKINYALIPALMVVVSLPTILKNTSTSLAVVSLTISYGVGFLVGKFFHNLFSRRSVNLFFFLFVTLATGFCIGVSTLLITQNYDSPFSFLILAMISYPITASLVSMAINADEQLAVVSTDLAAATKELAWNVARIREAQHQNQRNLARSLHGSVQAKLASAYLELEKIGQDSVGNTQRVNQILVEIRESISTVDTHSPEAPDLHKLIAQTVQSWASVAAVTSQISETDLAAIAQDPLCVVALIDVIPEAVFNAIKHGKADKIAISIAFKDDRVVELTVTDNGVNELVDLGRGLGTKILTEATITWQRKRVEGTTVTRAEFAYSLETALPN